MTIVEPEAATAPPAPTDQSGSPLITAADRGPGWMAEYGCTPHCVMDHTQPENNPGWHMGAEATCPAPTRLDSYIPGETNQPLMDAKVVTVNDTPEIFGITTTLWVGIAGDSMELTVPETDRFISALENFLPQLRALREQLAEVAKGDVPRNERAVALWHAEQDARARREAEAAEETAAKEAAAKAAAAPPDPQFSTATGSQMVRVSVQTALKHAADLPEMARAVSNAAHSAIREANAEPYLYACGEGNPNFRGMLPCILRWGHVGDHQSCTGDTFPPADEPGGSQ
jgi:hypothetical protein